MNQINSFKKEFYNKLIDVAPLTLISHTWKDKNEEVCWSKRISIKEVQTWKLNQPNVNHSRIWTYNTNEEVFDIDLNTFNEALEQTRILVKALEDNGINKYEIEFSGNKSTHIKFRFDSTPFEDYEINEVRAAIYKALDIKIKGIDISLFQTIQPITMPGYEHRKTGNIKQRIILTKDDFEFDHKIPINLDYLDVDYVNIMDISFIERVIYILNKNKVNTTTKVTINLDKKTNYSKEKLEWCINRFIEIYSTLEDGKKRVQDSFIRYIYTTTKDEDLTKQYFAKFCESVKISDLNNYHSKRVEWTINSIHKRIRENKRVALFPYSDVLTPKEFYKHFPFKVVQ